MTPYKVTLRDRVVCFLANFILSFGSKQYLAYVDVIVRLGRKSLDEVVLLEDWGRLENK